MKKFLLKKVVVLLSFCFLFISPNFLLAQESEDVVIIDPAPATVSINLKIIAEEDLLYDNIISVTACDSDNDIETEDSITVYCAILQSGLNSTWDWSWAPSAFLSSISDITGYTSLDNDGNEVYHYWSWQANDQEGMSALNQYELQPSDSILLEFISPEEEVIIPDPLPSVSVHLKIISGTDSLYDNEISVVACDSDNDTETEDSITAYCAILQSGLNSTWDWSWAPSAFLTSISNITGYTSVDSLGNDVYHFWSWQANDQEGITALNQYELQPEDLLLIEFISPEEEVIDEEEDGGNSGSNGGGGGGNIINPSFSLSKIFSFLDSNQTSNGFFINDMYSDWLAIALAKTTGETDDLKEKVYQNLLDRDFDSIILTDILRHSMALLAFNINPYNDKEINYIEKIISSFDGLQLGDGDLYNDDIFALIVLYHAGYTKNDEIIKKVSSFIISKQSNNGSWGSIDMTAVAIGALRNFGNLNGSLEAISKAESYLISKQESNGSFDNNIFSTSWAIQALFENDSFVNEVDQAISYLEKQQEQDGGFMSENSSLENRLWATSYALPAILRLSWSDILFSFDKIQEIEINNNNENTLVEEDLVDLNIEIEIEEIKLNEIEEVKKEDLVVVFKKDFIGLEEEFNDKNEINNQDLVASTLDLSEEDDKDNNNFILDIYSFLVKILSNFWFKIVSIF